MYLLNNLGQPFGSLGGLEEWKNGGVEEWKNWNKPSNLPIFQPSNFLTAPSNRIAS